MNDDERAIRAAIEGRPVVTKNQRRTQAVASHTALWTALTLFDVFIWLHHVEGGRRYSFGVCAIVSFTPVCCHHLFGVVVGRLGGQRDGYRDLDEVIRDATQFQELFPGELLDPEHWAPQRARSKGSSLAYLRFLLFVLMTSWIVGTWVFFNVAEDGGPFQCSMFFASNPGMMWLLNGFDLFIVSLMHGHERAVWLLLRETLVFPWFYFAGCTVGCYVYRSDMEGQDKLYLRVIPLSAILIAFAIVAFATAMEMRRPKQRRTPNEHMSLRHSSHSFHSNVSLSPFTSCCGP